MKGLLLTLGLVVGSVALLHADDKKKKGATESPAPEANEIHWITSIDELQAKMREKPKKVIVDMYTGWCGWCKRMDAVTYTNPSLIKYVNNNFYAVKFDAERQDTIRFQDKLYFFYPEYKANGFAIELMKSSMSYPTTIFMAENFQSPTSIPGFYDVKDMERFLTYFGDNAYRRMAFEDYKKTFTPRWDKGQPAPATVPAVPGH
jgi:thioredoxin-related protein